MLETIVVPLDGSDLGEMALPWAVEIAAALGSEVDLIVVLETKVEEIRNMEHTYVERKAEQSSEQIRERKPANAALPASMALASFLLPRGVSEIWFCLRQSVLHGHQSLGVT